MKKSNFVAMILGTIGGIFTALGMCMVMLPDCYASYANFNGSLAGI